MAFFGKAGNILRQVSQKHINQAIAGSKPSILQLIRCMSSSKVFVGGLAWSTDDTSLREAFSNYGDVAEARVIQDRETGRSRGFGFVTYASEEAASAAIQGLDGQELHGRRVRVNYANDRPRTFSGGGGYGGGGGGYGGRNYGSGGYGGNTYGEQGGGNTYGAQGRGGYNAGVGGFGGGDHFASTDGDSYASPGAVPSSGYGSYNSTTGSSGDAVDEQISNDNSDGVGGANGGYNPEEPSGGEFRDDNNTSGDFAERRG
ncbi:hypothetical protein Leryth_021899 [Lithospermum erythrorhizon]|nr:hypothetical protein Leryth_021899 [Lithospermum erythrorhizon]